MENYKEKKCHICGKSLNRWQMKYCGAVCVQIAEAKRETKWAQGLSVQQLRHWYAT